MVKVPNRKSRTHFPQIPLDQVKAITEEVSKAQKTVRVVSKRAELNGVADSVSKKRR
jgi:hypothetical protein